jgi:NADH:ubiquinone oxidoreductase subunit C
MTVVVADARAGHLLRLAEDRLGRGILEGGEGQPGEDHLHVHPDRLLELLTFLRDDRDAQMRLLVDITAFDRGPPERTDDDDGEQSEGESSDDDAPHVRYEVVYRLRSERLGYRAWVTVELGDDDPTIPTATELFPAADWYERELWDLFGIYADGHPHLRRLLTYEGFSGHPLRRDYPGTKAQPLVPLRSAGHTPDVVLDAAASDKEREGDDEEAP